MGILWKIYYFEKSEKSFVNYKANFTCYSFESQACSTSSANIIMFSLVLQIYATIFANSNFRRPPRESVMRI